MPNCIKVHLAVWLQGETKDQDITEPALDWTLMHIHWKMNKFLLRVTASLAMTQMTSLSQTSNSALAIQTVNLLYRYLDKEFFPSVERRLAVNLNLSPKVTIMTGHLTDLMYID